MRTNLLLRTVVPLVVLVAIATIVANHLAASFTNALFDSFLLNSADSVVARLKASPQGVTVADLPVLTREVVRHNGEDSFFYQVVDDHGRRLVGDNCFPAAQMHELTGPKFRNTIIQGRPVRLCRIPVAAGDTTVFVRVAETLNSRARLLNGIFWSILAPQLVLVILGWVSIWYGVSNGLRPLRQLVAVLEARTRPDLSPVVIDSVPRELMPVIDALNHLFSIVDAQWRLQREFVANAAHQLRTPVTALRTSVEYMERISTDPKLAVGLTQIEQATDRTVHLVNRLLSLARTAEAMPKELRAVDLANVINASASALIPLAAEREVELHFDLPDNPVILLGDEQDLEELVINLLDNAVKYTPNAGSVWLRVEQLRHKVRLIVEDTGPGIPDEEKEKVFRRFYRGKQTNQPGCGLGLAIVSEIVAGANAGIEILDRTGGGTVVRVVFPVIGTFSAGGSPQSGRCQGDKSDLAPLNQA